jgi:hyperosmotically inducible periplasmic protein
MKLKRVLLPVVLFLTVIATAFAAAKPVSDDFIYDTIKQKLAADPVVKGGAIEVVIKDGAVTLRGKVEEEKQRTKAEKIAKKVEGVKSVTNELQLAKP